MSIRCFPCAFAGSSALAVSFTAFAGVVSIEVVAMEGMVAPGTTDAVIGSLNAPFTNSNGQVGFTGSSSAGNFVWFDDQVVWLNSDAVGFTVSGAEGTMGIGNEGEFIYSPSTDGLDSVWTHDGYLAADEDPAPDFPGQFLTFCSRPTMLPDGTAHWISGLSTKKGGSSQARALYRHNADGISKVLATGDLIDSMVITGSSGVDVDYDFSDDGKHHIHFLLMNAPSTSDGFVYVDGSLTAREGTPTGDGDSWENFDFMSINESGNYVFSGNTDGPASSSEFIAYNGAIALREGQTIDGVDLTSGSVNSVSINNMGQVVYVWSIASANELLVVADADDLQASSLIVLRTGDEVALVGGRGPAPGAVITDFNASAVIGPGLSLADDGFVYVEVDLQDLTSGKEVEAIVRVSLLGDVDPCSGDIDSDGVVGPADLALLLGAWGPNPGDPADLDGDDTVGPADLAQLLGAWGPCR